jgi:hypothetical protein
MPHGANDELERLLNVACALDSVMQGIQVGLELLVFHPLRIANDEILDYDYKWLLGEVVVDARPVIGLSRTGYSLWLRLAVLSFHTCLLFSFTSS